MRRTSPRGSASSRDSQLSMCCRASKVGSPRYGFGSITSHGSRLAASTLPACRSVHSSVSWVALDGQLAKEGHTVARQAAIEVSGPPGFLVELRRPQIAEGLKRPEGAIGRWLPPESLQQAGDDQILIRLRKRL